MRQCRSRTWGRGTVNRIRSQNLFRMFQCQFRRDIGHILNFLEVRVLVYFQILCIIWFKMNGRAVRSIKEGTSAVSFRSGWMKSGGLIQGNAIAICEMFKTSWKVGEHLAKDDSENHSKAPSFRSVPWKKASRGFTNLVRKFLPGILLRICIDRGGNLERRNDGRRHCGAGNVGRVRNPCSNNSKELSTSKKKGWNILYSPSDTIQCTFRTI